MNSIKNFWALQNSDVISSCFRHPGARCSSLGEGPALLCVAGTDGAAVSCTPPPPRAPRSGPSAGDSSEHGCWRVCFSGGHETGGSQRVGRAHTASPGDPSEECVHGERTLLTGALSVLTALGSQAVSYKPREIKDNRRLRSEQ